MVNLCQKNGIPEIPSNLILGFNTPENVLLPVRKCLSEVVENGSIRMALTNESSPTEKTSNEGPNVNTDIQQYYCQERMK